MPEGTVVVDGIFYTAVPRQKGWYYPPDNREDEEVFLIQHFLSGNVAVSGATEDKPEPRIPKRHLVGKLVFMESGEMDRLRGEAHVRDGLELVEIERLEHPESDEDEDSEEISSRWALTQFSQHASQ